MIPFYFREQDSYYIVLAMDCSYECQGFWSLRTVQNIVQNAYLDCRMLFGAIFSRFINSLLLHFILYLFIYSLKILYATTLASIFISRKYYCALNKLHALGGKQCY